MARVGFYSGSFDPVTLGHLDCIARAARLVDTLVIGIGVHPGKTPLFSTPEKTALLMSETTIISKRSGCTIEVVTFAGLTVTAARDAEATVLDYEMQMAGMNGAMSSDIDTVFLPASPEVRHITATLVRQIAAMGGSVGPFVGKDVAKQLKAKFAKTSC
jgi:pantetheine-phosphate adenylyltransferase